MVTGSHMTSRQTGQVIRSSSIAPAGAAGALSEAGAAGGAGADGTVILVCRTRGGGDEGYSVLGLTLSNVTFSLQTPTVHGWRGFARPTACNESSVLSSRAASVLIHRPDSVQWLARPSYRALLPITHVLAAASRQGRMPLAAMTFRSTLGCGGRSPS